MIGDGTPIVESQPALIILGDKLNDDKKMWTDKADIYKVALIGLNIYLSVAVVFVSVYLIAFLFDGKLYTNAIIHYASWIGMALVLKFALKRVQKGLRIRVYDYLVVCVYTMICMFLLFRFPLNIILSILSIVGAVVSHTAQGSRLKRENG